MISLSKLKAFFFDLDGSIYRGEEPFRGADTLLNQLRKDRKTIGFITNNSTHTAKEVQDKLSKMGIEASEEEIITATEYVGIYLTENFGPLSLKVFGSQALQNALASNGHKVLPVSSQQTPEMIVIARDVTFNYDSLKYIVNDIKSGVKVISTNVDTHHPGTEGEIIPETGSITAAIACIYGKEIQHIAKPQPFIFQYAMKKCSSIAKQSIMIGDNYSTDITGGYLAGMKTAWIRSNAVVQDPKASTATHVKPTIIINEIRDLIEIYRSSKLLQPIDTHLIEN